MDEKHMPIGRDTVVERNECEAMGPVILQMPEGPALCHDAISCTTIRAQRQRSGEKLIAIIAVAKFGERHLGSISQFTPAQARSFAASLLGSADAIDGGIKGAN